MALKQCPACNGSVSTSVEECIHCGCKLKFCPECETAYLSDATKCQNCGYSFIPQTATAETQTNPEATAASNKTESKNDDRLTFKSLKEMWIATTGTVDLSKALSMVKSAFSTVAGILYLIYMLCLVLPGDILADITSGINLSIGKLSSILLLSVTIAVVFSIIVQITEVCIKTEAYTKNVGLFKWSNSNGYNLADILREEIKLTNTDGHFDYKKESAAIATGKSTSLTEKKFEQDFVAKINVMSCIDTVTCNKQETKTAFVCSLVSCAMDLCSLIFYLIFFRHIIEVKFSTFSIGVSDFTMLFVGIGLVIVSHIINKTSQSKAAIIKQDIINKIENGEDVVLD